ncbi:hypothetical protein BDA99DRAFT_529216 [Phascolomyces articulosus]|uniref:DUF6787 domain-containing protein n=1 Tax=Phascolomyces articulosus TaxID=60185 RepID=A0AAD5JLT9_9FUNG|nr:hypothetical protein BDA99DRAFT_529216 [Phascolomyces articulosus]
MATDEEANLLTEQYQQSPSTSEKLWTIFIWTWRFLIFGITGSSSVAVTKSIMHHVLGLSTPDNWIYFIVFFILELFVYTIMIITIGTCLGQWRFFCMVAFKMWGWILPIQLRQSLSFRLQAN